ncbi:MAG TPA: pyruvate ferredoxin oxidoreductase [Dehalococcoidia bacterium]|nr:pyruvate ferredoxin oxidoreductase [Dehalococcoidia bacterium]
MGTRDCHHICDESSPAIGEAGKTGEWRNLMPVIHHNKCIPAKQKKPACFLCWLFCPDAVISKTIPVRINLEYCKGCGICVQVCPAKAISMV